MHRKELNERSPLRVLEQSIHGGLGQGNLGVVVARKGVGKTAFLVGVALDDLMRGRKVLHVSLDQSLEKVVAHYDEIFNDLVHTQALEDVWAARTECERHRRIQCYLEEDFSLDHLRESLGFWKQEADFVPAAILVDGMDFESVKVEEIQGLKLFAKDLNVELWMSAITKRDSDTDDRGIPEPVAHLAGHFDVILRMAHDGRNVHIGLLKDHDNPVASDLKLALDPTTMLLVEEGKQLKKGQE